MTRLDLEIFRIAFRRSFFEPAELIGRLAFFAILLLIFSKLWQAVDLGASRFHAVDLIWYLALTEWVILSLPDLHHDIESDVRSGEITYRLCRPVAYLRGRFVESLGRLAARLLAIGVGGAGITYFWAGGLPTRVDLLWIALPFGLIAAFLASLFYALIGLTAIWLRDVMPLYWVWQKLTFLLGGLILPLDLYPNVIREIAIWSPFGAMLYGTGRWALAPSLSEVGPALLNSAIWVAILIVTLRTLERRALSRLEVAGG